MSQNARSSKRKKRLLDSDAQTESERAQLRKEYIDLRHDTLEHREELISNVDGKFQERLLKQNQMHSQVLFPSEAIHDLSHLSLLTELGVEQSRRWKVDTMKYSAEQFTQRISDASLSFYEIGQISQKFMKASPCFRSMLGSVVKEVGREEKTRTVHAKETVAEEISLDKNSERCNEEKTQTDERVSRCFQRLLELGRVNFFEFAFNPNSFSETIENIFDISFLVRQNKAGIQIDHQSSPETIYLESPNQAAAVNQDDAALGNSQAVVRLDIPSFKRIIKEHKLAESNAPLVGSRS